MSDNNFFQFLHSDMMQTRQRRFQYQLAKITSLGTLTGIGVIVKDNSSLYAFFYLVPFVAIAFDLYILSESFTLKRMAAYIMKEKKDLSTQALAWEKFVKENPDRHSTYANMMITLASVLGSVIALNSLSPTLLGWYQTPVNWIWLVSILFGLVLVKWLERTTHNIKMRFNDGPV